VLALWARGHERGQIAYELGVAASTVAGRLASSSDKLEARDATELMQRARGLLTRGDE
jgi:DNA-binding NarL/FixJ family response regulator